MDSKMEELMNELAELPGMEDAQEFVKRFTALSQRNSKEDEVGLQMAVMIDPRFLSEDKKHIMAGLTQEGLNNLINQIAIQPNDSYVTPEIAVAIKATMVNNIMALFNCRFVYTSASGELIETEKEAANEEADKTTD